MSSKETVAVVDDDPGMRASFATLLSAAGYRVETYDSAEMFLMCASICKADCLIIDINLRDISGIELARQLVSMGTKWPIIFTSGHGDTMTRRQIASLDPVAFIPKPFAAKDLIDAIRNATGPAARN